MTKLSLVIVLALAVAATGFLWARRSTGVNGIAEIVRAETSVRVRPSRKLTWANAYPHQKLAPDDAVYTGGYGQARILLKHGTALELSANSLLEINALEVPKLELGNLRLSLQGELRFNLAGRVIELHGQDAEIQIFIEEGGAGRLRLLSGSASLPRFPLEKGKIASLDRPDVEAGFDPILSAHAAVEARQQGNEYFYKDRLEDLYQRGPDGAWLPRASREPLVDKAATLRWRLAGLPPKIYVQLANDREFTRPLEFNADGETLELKKVFLGNNFWRVSVDRKTWSEAYFKVSPLPIPTEPPRLDVRERRLSDGKSSRFPIESTTGYRAYLVEVSPWPLFPPQTCETTWITDATFLFTAHKVGEYFLRVRGVNVAGEVSEPSAPEKITVEHAP